MPSPRDPDNVRNIASRIADPENAPGPPVPPLLTAGQLIDADYPPRVYAVEPICPVGEFGLWTGAHGIFKSTIALAACLCVATGRRFAGLPVLLGKSAFITVEDSERTLSDRVKAWLESIPVGDERKNATELVRANFRFLAREQVRRMKLTILMGQETRAEQPTIDCLIQNLAQDRLAILETSAKLSEGNENDNRSQGVLAQAVEEVVDRLPALHVGVVQHVGKAAARDETVDSYAGRGGGALADAARSVLVFHRQSRKKADDAEVDPLGPVAMRHAKSTHARPAADVLWRPIVAPSGGVYLRTLSNDERALANAARLLAAMPPDGLTESQVHKSSLAGLSRLERMAALRTLRELGRVEPSSKEHGRNKLPVLIYVPTKNEP